MSSALQLDRRLRWSLYAAFALLFATGAAWLLADQLKDSADGEFWHATIANVLMVHGGVAMVTLLLLGAIFPIHIARAWRGRLNRCPAPCNSMATHPSKGRSAIRVKSPGWPERSQQ
jgi:hypothetical protein